MEVLNHRSALLSNYEVLTLLRELEADHLAKTKTALRIKKEEEQSGKPPLSAVSPEDEICENLRTIEVEAIQYLAADYQPTTKQSEAGITTLVKGLAPFNLTKAEKLQTVNLAPTEPVELYVIVEELEDRLGEHMTSVLTTVESSLAASPSGVNGGSSAQPEPPAVAHSAPTEKVEDRWDHDDIMEWDDHGEGAGVEGDLEADDE